MSNNPFDEFDDVPVAATVPPQGNPFDEFDEPDEENIRKEEAYPDTFFGQLRQSLEEAQTVVSDRTFGGEDLTYDTSNIDPAIMEAFGQPKLGMDARVQTAASETVKAGSNILIDGGMRIVKTMVPDFVQDAVVDFSRSTWDQFSSNPTVKKGLETLGEGMEAYQGWAKEHPEEARRIGEAINLGAFGRAQGKLRPNRTPDAPKRRGDTYLKKNAKDGLNNRKAQVRNMLEPATKKHNYGTYYEDARGTIRWDPNNWIREVIDETARVRGFNPKRSYVHNMNATRKQSRQFKVELDELVSKRGGKVNIGQVKADLQSSIDDLAEEVLLTGDAEAMARKIYLKAEKLLDASDGTAKGVLDARRALDEWVSTQRNVYDSSFESATTYALRDIRGTMNDAVDSWTRSPRVKELLGRQHKLLTAADMLEEKLMKQADTWFGRLVQNVESATHTKFPTTPLAAGATLAAGAAIAGPAGIGGGAALFGAYKGAKWLMSVDGKRWLAQVVRYTDTYPQLKPEVNALIQISNGLDPSEESVQDE